MTHRARSLLCTLMIAACDDDAEIAAICEGDVAVQLIATATPPSGVEITPARGSTMMYIEASNRGATHLGRGCGAKPVRVADGARMRVAAIHPDPADDDPTLGCMFDDYHYFRLDPKGSAPPKLLLPWLSCVFATPTEHGVLVMEDFHGGSISSGWWHYPDFPSASGALRIEAAGTEPQVRGRTLYYHYWKDSTLRTYDLVTQTSDILLSGVAAFGVSDTHVLWREEVTDGVAPMRLLDLATGARIELGVSDPAIDHPPESTSGWAWNFDARAEHVLHVPGDPEAPREAFDLTGARRTFPMPGVPFMMLPGGHVLSIDTATVELFATRPGDASPARLDYRPGDDYRYALTVVGERIQAVVGNDLHDISLDGSPAIVLVRDVGPGWTWLGEHQLVTAFDGELTAIDTRTGARAVHGEHALYLERAPDGGGVYYLVAAEPGDPRNGLWFLPVTALAP
ncbi:MAG TPA: hypothetical protein VGB85_05400 [Nannocystis sp.]|jgi:hypothetical protein